jgi:hypothetical protein
MPIASVSSGPFALTAAIMPSGTPSSSAHQAGDGEFHRVAEAFGDQRAHGRAETDRLAEIADHRAADEAQVLHDQRVVQAHLLAQLGEALGRHSAALGTLQHQLRRIAGQRVHDAEDDQRNEEQDREKLQQAVEDVPAHRPSGDWT